MFAAAVGHRSGRATPSLRDAPQQQSMEIYPESAGTRTNRLPKREMGILLTE